MSTDPDTLAATKLTRTEFAVVRAYAQGMRPVDIANRYLLDPDDDDVLTEHQAVQRILTLRDRLVQFALQHDRPDIAAMFEALRGRSDAGMTRRVDALSSIERLGQGRPLPGHQVSLWFRPSLARRLATGGVRTIADLTDLANQRGSSWWRAVPRIGQQSAEIITRWLRQQQLEIATAVRPYVMPPSQHRDRPALVPARLGPAMRDPIPLEHMLTPAPDYPGAISLGDDLRFICDWVARRSGSPNTAGSYRREAERLLLWVAQQRGSVQALEADDLARYRSFLADPQPASFWCGPAGARDRALWRPFEGPLGASSIEASMRVVRALLRAMARSGLRQGGQAVLAGSVPVAASESIETNRSNLLPPGVVEDFLDWLGTADPSPRQRAARATALLLHRHGVRISALPAMRLGDVRLAGRSARLLSGAQNESEDSGLRLDEDVWMALRAHWADRGIQVEAGWNANAALLAPSEFPATKRGRAKQAQDGAGYAASGLDQLLRGTWKRFAAGRELPEIGFTPRLLARAGRPLPDAPK
ncbi:Phage integrase protein [compost metagenome]|uniref:phage integrase family protein n=1 Tax=Cupriavidus sp. SIMBA_020 TaxID=3085766 RepID=UPI000FAC5089